MVRLHASHNLNQPQLYHLYISIYQTCNPQLPPGPHSYRYVDLPLRPRQLRPLKDLLRQHLHRLVRQDLRRLQRRREPAHDPVAQLHRHQRVQPEGQQQRLLCVDERRVDCQDPRELRLHRPRQEVHRRRPVARGPELRVHRLLIRAGGLAVGSSRAVTAASRAARVPHRVEHRRLDVPVECRGAGERGRVEADDGLREARAPGRAHRPEYVVVEP